MLMIATGLVFRHLVVSLLVAGSRSNEDDLLLVVMPGERLLGWAIVSPNSRIGHH